MYCSLRNNFYSLLGYGNVTCKTPLGRIVTMVYALIGIPLMFLCLANLGNLLAETFRFSYKRICCICFCCGENSLCSFCYGKRNKAKNGKTNTNENIELEVCDTNKANDSPKETRVNFEIEERKVTSVVAMPPSPTASSNQSSFTSSPITKSLGSTPAKSEVSKQNSEILIVQNKYRKQKDRVPLWLIIILVIGYIMAGALWFSIWEKDWGLLNGAYFCFITLTTIGFGDLVPGAAKNLLEDSNEQTNFIICAIYVIMGLSLIAMSFNLAQEEITIRCKEFARRIGILPQLESDSRTTAL